MNPPLYIAEQPAKRMQVNGKKALSSAELISIVISQKSNAKSEAILAKLSLQELASMSVSQIKSLGVTSKQAEKIAAAFEIGRRVAEGSVGPSASMCDPRTAAEYMMPKIGHLSQEEVWVLCLNTRGRLIAARQAYRGTHNAVMIEPHEILRTVMMENSSSYILVHNHPSQDVTPSQEDIRTTQSMVNISRIMKLDMRDHIIVSSQRYISLRERGLGFNN